MTARAPIIALALACSMSLNALAQDKADKRDDLDVTMQIIVDPNAKSPDEVVRRIPLPAPRPTSDPARASPEKGKPESPSKELERSQEARELGREASERARERARETAQQREEARNANADRDKDKDKDKDRDRDRPDPPNRPPRP